MVHRPRKPLLTDKQWKRIEPLLPALPKSKKGGRPWASNRAALEGILWILRSGARWQDLPDWYPSPFTCWRRLQRWEEDDTWLEIWRAFLSRGVELGDEVFCRQEARHFVGCLLVLCVLSIGYELN